MVHKIGTMRVSREGVAQLKQALDFAVTQTKEKHAVEEEKTEDKSTS